MGKIQKKHGKGRLDHYYRLAKEKGYRARSSFKIIQINEKYGHFLEKAKVVIDLCAAPGSWCQVASQLCPINSLIIGVDIVPIKPLPNVITFTCDITSDACRSQLRGHLKTWKADVVLHDGAPNVGMAWFQDAFTQSELVLQSMRLANEFLNVGGTFVTKVFRSKDYNNLMWIFQQFFEKVEATKPPSSRNVSAEIFVVCKGFKAPKKVDPRLLDPKYVFEELASGKENTELKVFKPERKTKNREGYEDPDNMLLSSGMDALEFVKTEDPIDRLGSLTRIDFAPKAAEDDESATQYKLLKKLPETTPELLECLKDLKVLNRKDFKLILKWRLKARELLKLDEDEDKEENVEVEEIDEDELIDKEIEEVRERERLKSKRQRRKANEKKQKEIIRNQMNMQTPTDIGVEGHAQEMSFFNLRTAQRTGKLNSLSRGANEDVLESDSETFVPNEQTSDSDSDDYEDRLEAELDAGYEQFKEHKAERDAAYRAKLKRKNRDDEWNGIKDNEAGDSDDMFSDKDYANEDDSSEDDYDDEVDLVKHLPRAGDSELSRRAAVFFDNPLFRNVGGDDDDEEDEDAEDANDVSSSSTASVELEDDKDDEEMDVDESESDDSELSDDAFEVVARDESDDGIDWQHENEAPSKPRIDMVTPEAMTLAHQLATRQTNKHKLIDQSYGKYSFQDHAGLPDWFVDDENKHNKVMKPITKEASEALKVKMRALNSRPIKKVMEAKSRKKMRALRRLEKMKKKSDMINEDSSKTEAEKSEDIAKLMKRLTKKENKRPKVTLVYAKHGNKGLQGRPRGVKGKYKMVDGAMKKEQRALKRIAKKRKK